MSLAEMPFPWFSAIGSGSDLPLDETAGEGRPYHHIPLPWALQSLPFFVIFDRDDSDKSFVDFPNGHAPRQSVTLQSHSGTGFRNDLERKLA